MEESNKFNVFLLPDNEYFIESAISNRSIEQLGTKDKFWFRDNYNDLWLFKYSRDNTGEHWSEKIAEQLCSALGIPHAQYELAKYAGKWGVLSLNLVVNDYKMTVGNEVLYSLNPTYYPKPENSNEAYMHIKEHTIDSIFDAFNNYNVLPPITEQDFDPDEVMDACDVFCGYLMLDTLISNQDRHHENWAILESPDGKRYLSLTFDHAASLGRELLDEEREQRLSSNDQYRKVGHFVSRARSEIFSTGENKRRLSTIDAFFESVKERSDMKNIWLSRLEKLTPEKIISIFDRVPEYVITLVAKKFAITMVLENRKRLLEDER